MKAINKIIILATIICLTTACASKKIEPSDERVKQPESATESTYTDSPNPPPTFEKGSKELKLVRMMEGGACKTDKEGAKGVFLIYSDPVDIERIKLEKGTDIFSSFEKEIQDFSLVALDNAVKSTDISDDPFALDNADAQSKVFDRLAMSFRSYVTVEIAKFEQKTSLTIAIITFKRTFEFYINNCEATHMH